LPPLYGGGITAGNASKLAEGAGVVVVVNEREVAQLGVRPLAQVVDTAVVGTEPEDYGIAPVKAVWKLIDKVGLTMGDYCGILIAVYQMMSTISIFGSTKKSLLGIFLYL